MKSVKITSCIILVLCFTLISSLCFAAPPNIISPSELKKGMLGVGKTVVEGTKIETFNVQVIDVMKKAGESGGDLILVRVSGDVIKRTGGIAQGMSGSPVFFNGKLAGAVAFGWSFSDPNIGMLTPIEDMLKLSEYMRLDLIKKQQERDKKLKEKSKEDELYLKQLKSEAEEQKGKPKKEDTDATGIDSKEQNEKNEEQLKDEIKEISKKKEKRNVSTPIIANGFSKKGLEIIKAGFKEFDVVQYDIGSAPYALTDVKLEPGSAVSIELIRGDVSLGSIGTVTWVDGNEVLAFGHPFTKRGKVNYFMSNAWTFATIPSLNSSFKLSASGNLLGVTLQDRSTGISGKLNLYPDVVPILVKVMDHTNNINKFSTAQIVQDELYSPYLASAAVISIIDKTIDRVGEGTARVKFTIRAQDLPEGREIMRENMFYSVNDITSFLASEMFSGLLLLTGNRFQDVSLTDVNVEIDISERKNTATIISARPLSPKAKPGDTIGIEVTLHPYRSEKVTQIVNFTIPKNQQEGSLGLMIRGGTSLASLQNIVNQQHSAETAVLLRADSSKNKTFLEEIDDFNKKDRNNDIVVDLITATNYTNNKQIKYANEWEEYQAQEQQLQDFVQGTEYKTNTQANYIITGETTTVVEIEKEKTA